VNGQPHPHARMRGGTHHHQRRGPRRVAVIEGRLVIFSREEVEMTDLASLECEYRSVSHLTLLRHHEGLTAPPKPCVSKL
jgi:hypothetical protein